MLTIVVWWKTSKIHLKDIKSLKIQNLFQNLNQILSNFSAINQFFKQKKRKLSRKSLKILSIILTTFIIILLLKLRLKNLRIKSKISIFWIFKQSLPKFKAKTSWNLDLSKIMNLIFNCLIMPKLCLAVNNNL